MKSIDHSVTCPSNRRHRRKRRRFFINLNSEITFFMILFAFFIHINGNEEFKYFILFI